MGNAALKARSKKQGCSSRSCGCDEKKPMPHQALYRKAKNIGRLFKENLSEVFRVEGDDPTKGLKKGKGARAGKKAVKR